MVTYNYIVIYYYIYMYINITVTIHPKVLNAYKVSELNAED